MRMTLKMAAAAFTITLLLLCCSLIASTDSQDGCGHYVATGDNFTVPLQYRLEDSDNLRWMHNDETILNRRSKTLFINGRPDDVYENGSLKLTNLKKSNAGKYTPSVFTKDGNAVPGLKSIQLCILDRVPKPTVKTTCPSAASVTFTCTFTQAKDLKFEWLQNNVLVKEKDTTLKRTAKEVEKDSFSCRVFNRISSKTSDHVKQTCYEPKPIFPKTLFGIDTWIIVGGGGGVVLVLIIIVIVCCIRRKRTQLKDESELRLAWTNPNQQQQQQHHQHQHQHNHPPDHHHHHHQQQQQQQPAGHTGPRQHRSKQQRPRAPDHASGQPQPSPRRPAQGPGPVDDEKPPPLPQPRKKAPKRV